MRKINVKSAKLPRFGASSLVLLSFLAAVSSGFAQHPPYVYIWSPTNGAMYLAPANLTLYARAVGNTNPVQTVQFFAGNTSLGAVTNLPGVLVTNVEPLYPLAWSNVLAGNYALKAVATDVQGLMATSSVVNISVVTNLPPPPIVRPSVYIYSPLNGSVYLAPANLTLYARAVETTGTVQTVEFFAGNASLGVVSNNSQMVVSSISSAPLFPLAWSNVWAGNYALTAVATDAKGITATSSVVNISVVTNAGNLPLAVRLQYPTNGQTYTALARIEMHAQVVDSNLVQTVEFFAGTTSLGTTTNTRGVLLTNWTAANTFSLVWSNVVPGRYALTAVAADTAGVMATSPPVNITVLWPPPPVVSMWYPTNGQTFYTPINIGVHARVADMYAPMLTMQYFANGTSIGIVTNTQRLMVTNLNSSNPFFLNWSNVTAGIYALTAVATDSLALMGTSAPVTITVIRPPPTITFYSPTNGQAYYAPANITLNPRVMDLNAVVTTVEYFANGTSIGLVSNKTGVMLTNLTSSTPFYMTWSNVVAGSYILTALATDAGGYLGTSAPVTITVATRPPPNIPLAVGWWYPTNGQTFTAPANIGLHAWVVDSNVVRTVQYFAGTNSIGIVTNTAGVLLTNTTTANPFFLLWSNVPAGAYALTAVASDSGGNVATSPPVNITVLSPPPPSIPLTVGWWYPTNGQTFTAPANIGVHAWVVDSNVVLTVQYFAGTNSIGIVTNTAGVLLTNTTAANPFYLLWSNVPAGGYALTAVASDSGGNVATSPPVNITVLSRLPPNIPLTVGFWYPTNGQTFTAPANIGVHAWVLDSNVVRTVQYFANTASIGIVTNTAGVLLTNMTAPNPFFLLWSNVSAGGYALMAVATDSGGNLAISAPANITVLSPPPPTNRPPEVRITSPPNAAVFRAPVNLPIYAYARDPDGSVTSVEFFAGTNSLGLGNPLAYGTNRPPSSYYTNMFFIVWSNALVGSCALTAKACDNSNACAVSFPVHITILPPSTPPTNHVPVVTITAIDPLAIEGTNCWVWSGQPNPIPAWTNWPGGTRVLVTNCGPKNATFSIYRSGDTNSAMTVAYAIGGTASNGVDYVTLPGTVTISTGQRQAMISVVPIDDGPPDRSSTVILKLIPSTSTPPAYLVGSPASAEAIIFDSLLLNPQTRPLSDRTFHINAGGPNGAWFHVEYSTDLRNWQPICTNQVVNGWIDFIDPDASVAQARFYRAVPENSPPQ